MPAIFRLAARARQLIGEVPLGCCGFACDAPATVLARDASGHCAAACTAHADDFARDGWHVAALSAVEADLSAWAASCASPLEALRGLLWLLDGAA